MRQKTALQPLDRQQRQLVIKATNAYVAKASQLWGRVFAPLPVCFDLRGRAAGMYRVRNGQREIRYNPYIFAKYYDAGMTQTVPHEVAHYVVDVLYGLRRVRPHGREWQQVMRSLGAEPRATASFDLTGVPVRRQQRFNYVCACDEALALSARRHNAVRRGTARYYCRRCGQQLRAQDERA